MSSPPPSQPHKRRHVVRTVALVAVGALVLLLIPILFQLGEFAGRLIEGERAEAGLSEFYTAPSPVPAGDPGDIIRMEPIVGAPAGSQAWRVLYHSTDEQGSDTLVSGTIVAPATPATEPRTVVSWGHPTTGTAPRCAPSVGIEPFFFIEGLTDLLAAGYVVVATDYSGMGLPGPPSFLLGTTESANVLDIARAAQQIPDAGAGSDIILWGHSQGGHAAIFAAHNAASYAPDLNVLGVAVAAPATDLGELLNADISDVSGITIGAYAFTSYAAAYADQLPADSLSIILTPNGVDAVPSMSDLCLLGQNSEVHAIARPLIGSFIASDPATTSPWAELLAENSPPAVAVPVPLFVAQGESDGLVRPEITADFVRTQQVAGADITSHTYAGVGHGTIALEALPDVLRWMEGLE